MCALATLGARGRGAEAEAEVRTNSRQHGSALARAEGSNAPTIEPDKTKTADSRHSLQARLRGAAGAAARLALEATPHRASTPAR